MLPTDLLLEIATRFDPTTVLCYVATCRHLQHRTADLAFLRRTCQHDGYGFIPTLLPGVLIYRKATNSVTTFQTLPSATTPLPHPVASFVEHNADLFKSHTPVASHDGLLVLRRDRRPGHPAVELSLCNPMTGHVSRLPPATLEDDLWYIPLAEPNDYSTFRLLIIDTSLQTQTFSSTSGAWGPVVISGSSTVPLASPRTPLIPALSDLDFTNPNPL